MKLRLVVLLCLFSTVAHTVGQKVKPLEKQWSTYGGDPGGQRYSSAAQITKSNVKRLKVAWIFNTGATESDPNRVGSFEATPIILKGSMYLSSPQDVVYAIDPETGARHWSFDPQLDWTRNLGIITSRGVASWSSSSEEGGKTATRGRCSDRIFLGTLDGRLIALDAATGERCVDFGKNGVVDLTRDIDYRQGDDYAVTSPPTVIGDVVVVGAGIEDNLRVDVELGDVRGFDVHTGKLLWTWEPIPWAKHQKLRTGAANTWSVIAADQDHGLIFLPTSSPSPDYYGGLRPGDNQDADSIVALNAQTGRKVWAFQVVHHNVWDYDIAAEPLLFTFRGEVPAVAVATKMGLVFVFNRLTGDPLYPIHEKPVPTSDLPGEVTSPTQPFADLPPLSPITLDLKGPLGATAEDDADCRKVASTLNYHGIYTPPTLGWTLLFPSNVGGVNWGSTAFDPETGILYANTNRVPFLVKLQKRPLIDTERPLLANNATEQKLVRRVIWIAVCVLVATWLVRRRIDAVPSITIIAVLALAYLATSDKLNERLRANHFLGDSVLVAPHFGKEFGRNAGAPYVLLREPWTARGIRPCGPTPWGAVSALNLDTGKTAWQTPLGTKIPGMKTGTMNVGGPIVTAGGLVFTAASQEPLLRAFDAATGKELWDGKLPVPAQATPMTYKINGKQYVVVSDGGSSSFGTATGNSVVAFALP